jgi:hypothetical protein
MRGRDVLEITLLIVAIVVVVSATVLLWRSDTTPYPGRPFYLNATNTPCHCTPVYTP